MKTLLLASLGLVLCSGCSMLVPGPAADAGIRYTSQGVRTEVSASPERIAEVSANVLTGMGIHPGAPGSSSQTTATGGTRIVLGKGNVDQVTIQIEGGEGGSHVEVLDWTGNGNWDQDFAAMILLQIKNSAAV